MNTISDTDTLSQLLSRRSVASAQGTTLDAILPVGSQPFSRARAYRLYVPAGHDAGKPAPLVVVLHGCHQSHEDIQKIAGLDALADREQFLVLYPYVTSYLDYRARECWGWWIRRHRTRGQGEVEDIARMVDQVSQTHDVDTARRYICGLSSGGAMAVACLASHPDKYTGGASVAGLAYGERAAAVKGTVFSLPRYRSLKRLCAMTRESLAGAAPPNLLIVHSEDDDVVSTAATDSLEHSWLEVAGLDATPDWWIAGESAQVPWSLRGHTGHGQQRLVRLDVEGLPHGWLGGSEGVHSSPDAPCISELIWWHLNATATCVRSDLHPSPVPLLQQAS